MIETYTVSKNAVKRDKISSKSRGTKIVYTYSPSKEDIDKIKEKYNLNLYDINNALDPNERPRLDVRDKYTLILFRAPIQKMGNEVVTFGIFLIDKDILIVSHYDIYEITHLMHKLPEREFDHDRESLIYEILETVTDTYFKVLDSYDEKLESIEEKIVKKPGKKDLQSIFTFKKGMVYIHKGLIANREVVSSIQRGFSKQIKGSNRLNALYNTIIEIIDIEEIQRDIATGVIDLYMSSVSNNMNNVMKILTVIATIVLVPTLISGIYGMNIDLPLQGNSNAFLIIISLMLLSMIIIWLWFKKEKWT